MANTILELSDAVSVFQSKMETMTEEIVRKSKDVDGSVTMEFLDLKDEKILVTCSIDGHISTILMEKEPRLPFGDTREQIVENGLDFLFLNTNNVKSTRWLLSPDISDDDNGVKYNLTAFLGGEMWENPSREGYEEYRLAIYSPSEGKQENVDGFAVLELGNDLMEKSGLLHYYSYRTIEQTFINRL